VCSSDLPADIFTFDPYNTQDDRSIFTELTIYERLVKLSAVGKGVEPELATSCTVAQDGLSAEFVLRDGVKFWDGSPLTAHDAAFSLNILKSKGHPVISQMLRDLESAEAEADDVLVLRFAPDRTRDLCFGTVDSWIAWVLSNGSVHVTDHSNAAVTGLLLPDATAWSTTACAALGVPMGMLPAVVDTSGVFGQAHALPGAPPLAALVGDQQGSQDDPVQMSHAAPPAIA